MVIVGKNSLNKAHRGIILVGLMFCITLLMCNFASAFELNPFADKKIYEPSLKEDMSDFIKQDFNSKYGAIRLSKTFLWIETDKVAEYSLTENTDQCLINCESSGRAVLYSDGKLFDSKDFINKKGNNINVNSQYYIKVIEEYEVEVPDKYESVCTPNIDNKTGMGKEGGTCIQEPISYKKEIRTREVWNEYNFETLEKGEYEWKVLGSKNPNQDIDFIPTARGEEFDEWVWWNSSWNYKKAIFQNNTGSSTLNNLTYYIKIDTATLISENKLQNDCDDMRFLNFDETTEFKWEFVNKANTTYGCNSTQTLIRVLIPSLSAGGENVYFYYGNPTATAYNNPVTNNFPAGYTWVYDFESSTQKSLTNTGGSAELSPTGSPAQILGMYGTAFRTTASSNYFNEDDDWTEQSIGTMFWKVKFNGGLSGDKSLIRQDGSGYQQDWYVGWGGSSDTAVRFYIQDQASSTTYDLACNQTYVSGEWIDIAIQWGAGGMRLFYNGTLCGQNAYTGVLGNVRTELLLGAESNVDLDDWIFTTKRLSLDEIKKLNQMDYYVFGVEEITERVIITLNSPADELNISSSSINFNATIAPKDATIKNVTLYLNDEEYLDLYDTNETINYSKILSLEDGSYTWNITACWIGKSLAEDCTESATRSFYIDATPPTINILYPTGTLNYGYVGQNISLNYSITDANLDSCWLDYQGVNTTIPCASNSTMILNTTKTLTLWANDSLGNTNYSTASWDYATFNNAEIYNTETYETANEDFYLNLTYNSSASAISIKLNYNNTNYSTTSLGSGDNGYFKASLPIPLINTEINQTFFWYITTTSTTATDGTNQTIKPITLTACNTTYPTNALNFTLYDETTRAVINATSNTTSFEGTFYYWYGDGSLKKMYAYQNLSSNSNNFNFCIYPNITLKTDFIITYTATDYVDRTYNTINLSINNVSQPISLYLLLEDLGTKFYHSVREGVDVVPNVLVKIEKFIVGEGLFKEVGIRKTDIDGKFVEWLEQDKEYNYTILSGSNAGVSIEKNALCSVAPCEITLQIDGTSSNVFEEIEAYLASYVNYSLTFNKTSKVVTLNFEDLLGTAQYWRLYVYKPYFNNDTLDTICDVYSYSVSGSLTCNTTGYLGDLEARVYISRSPEKLVDFLKFLNEDVTDTLGITGMFASIIILLVLIFTGTRSPTNAMIMLPFGLTILKFLGFLPLSWGTIMVIVVIDLIILSKMMKG